MPEGGRVRKRMSELYDKILFATAQRKTWEDRQSVWYMMRTDGLRRSRPPYAGAPDLHWPLIDDQITKFKPLFFNMIFQGQRVAEFVAEEPQLKAQAESAADYFDYQVTEESNFTKEMLTTIDQMLLRGRAVIKVGWNPIEEKLEFRNIDTLYFLVPRHGDEIEEMDWFADVQVFSVDAYLRDPRFTLKDETVLAQIKGNPNYEQTLYQQDKYMREGLTYSTNTDEIVVWEVWEKQRGGYSVSTFSPMMPDIPLRDTFQAGYKLKGKPIVPYQSFQFEVVDKGWYAPRGIAEKLAAFEAILCKLENTKLTFLEYIDKPVFTNDEVIPANTQNITLAPGSALPKGMKPAQMPQMPTAMGEEMRNVQLEAEQYINTPTAGLTPDPSMGGNGEKPTATQINYQSSVASGQVNMDGKITRTDLAKLFRKAWAIILFHKPEDLAYFSSDERKVLPPEALAESYRVIPSGSPDDYDKQKRIQRALARRQTFFGDPRIDQGKLDEDVLIADDPRLVPRLYLGDNQRQAMEGQKQAYELLLLKEGRQVLPEITDDHPAHIQEIMHYLQTLGQKGTPVDPIAQQRILEHLQMHVQMLKQQNPEMADKAIGALQGMDTSTAGGPQPAGDPNVMQMPSQNTAQPQQQQLTA